MTSTTRLQRLHAEQGQSPWIDNLTRPSVREGGLAGLIEKGVRGVTSNPTIFEKAMSSSDLYDEQFSELLDKGSVEDAFWTMAIDDVAGACAVMRPVYDSSGGADGFVSLEVAPSLATNTEGTISAARNLHERIDLPNLMVKVPATAEGVPAIRQMITEGRNINVTLIFSLDRYAEVIEAYIAGLEAFAATGGDVSQVHSVASFFVSRVDTEVDRRLETVGSEAALDLRGKAAVAQARRAYALFQEQFGGDRWEALVARGAHPQRPLWASTSTKNKAYPDLLYVESLIGPETVDTMPDATVDAFLDHGELARTVDVDPAGAAAELQALSDVGVDMREVARVLEDEGVASFAKSFDSLIQALSDKANSLKAQS